MAIMPAWGPARMAGLMLNGKRIATATIRLPERWRDSGDDRGANGFRRFHRQSADGDAAREHLLMNLRLAKGSILPPIEARWGTRPAAEKIAPLIEQDLLHQDGDMLARHAARPAGAECGDCAC